MYAVYRQAHTPTAVEFSVYCNFISSKEKNLVVAGTSQLFVYRIIHDVEVAISLNLWLGSLCDTCICDVYCFCRCLRVHQRLTSPQVRPDLTSRYIFYLFKLVHLWSDFTLSSSLQIPNLVRKSWSRWRPSLYLAMWCPWPVCSLWEPTEMHCFSVSKMQR